jgi:hypothetical protein
MATALFFFFFLDLLLVRGSSGKKTDLQLALDLISILENQKRFLNRMVSFLQHVTG